MEKDKKNESPTAAMVIEFAEEGKGDKEVSDVACEECLEKAEEIQIALEEKDSEMLAAALGDFVNHKMMEYESKEEVEEKD